MDNSDKTSLLQKFNTDKFLYGVELTSSRGIISESKIEKTINFGENLINTPEIDWISVTDNAGGHPTLRPATLGEKFINSDKQVIIHLTCKDMNRIGLESTAWSLASKGFNNILALTGDYPQNGYMGGSKPVFDLDSVTLLNMLSNLNNGLETGIKKKITLEKTDFFLGASISNYKKNENELIPQYKKLLTKIENGASFIIPQVGFDSKKIQELKLYLENQNLGNISLIGNIYLLSKFTANLFHKNRIPGIVLTDKLHEKCMKEAKSQDKGKTFFIEFAAKMLSITKGLGYKGAYFGGLHNIEDTQRIFEVEKSFSPDDWKIFAKEISYSQNDEHFLYQKDEETGLLLNKQIEYSYKKPKLGLSNKVNYSLSKLVHKSLFTPNKIGFNLGKKISDSKKYKTHLPKWIHTIEKLGKETMYDCKDCGDCGLQFTAYICPESQCPKGQRNGPCGGTFKSTCEVHPRPCIWSKTYDRLKTDKKEEKLLSHSPIFKDNTLLDTSGWANFWLGLDNGSKISAKKNEE